MVIRNLKRCFVFILCFLISSCSYSKVDDEQFKESGVKFENIGLYLGRGSLSQADFEQYRVSDRVIYVECGVMKHGNNIPQAQSPFPLSKEDSFNIQKHIYGLYEALANTKFKFDKPGIGRGMADPGELIFDFSLNGKFYKIHTSVDSVSDPSTLVEIKLKQIVQSIRSATKHSLCGLKDFYGINNK